MSAHRPRRPFVTNVQNGENSPANRRMNSALNALLDFGPEDVPPSTPASERIKSIVKQIQAISDRIDKLSESF